MKLYYAPGTCALACWIALEWAGADYEAVLADVKSEEYQRVNPLGAVPALDIGKERAISQASAILTYISERYPQADLGGLGTPEENLELNEIMSFLASDLHPAFWPYFFPQRYTTATDEASLTAAKEASYARIDRAMQYLDKVIGDKDHVWQNRRSIADAYAFVMVRWTAKLDKTWEDYPNIARLVKRMQDDPAVQHVLAHQSK